MKELLKLAALGKGRIVCTGDLTPLQIADAQASSRFYADDDSIGWVLLPWEFWSPPDLVRDDGAATRENLMSALTEARAENTRLQALLNEPCDCAAGEIQVNSEAWERKAVKAEKENTRLREALEALSSILTDPEGNPCFEGSDGDREVARLAFAALAGKEPSDGSK